MSKINIATNTATTEDSCGVGSDLALLDQSRTARGIVDVIIEEDGIETIHHHKDNIFVIGGAKALAHLIREADANYQVTNFKLGTQGHDLGTPDILTAVAPVKTDSSLIDVSAAVFSKALALVDSSYLPVGVETRVEFNLVAEKVEANGGGTVAYTEAGLYAANGDMVCRETFPAAVKNAARKLTIKWVLVFD